MHRVVRGADVLATAEQMLLHVDARTGRAGPARADVLASVDRLAADHGALPAPDGAGRRVEMKVSAA
jgi:carnitine 3-dehydrogenase